MLGLADVVALNDPITGQGANSAAKSADAHLQAIVARGGRPFDERWMADTAMRVEGYQDAVTRWTNAVLAPPGPHVLRVFAAAAESPDVAMCIGDGFDHPPALAPVWENAAAAERLIARHDRVPARAR